MPQISAGLLLYRILNDEIQVFLTHFGGPFWKKKDEAAWTIPKGLVNEGENLLDAAKREFREETGFEAEGAFIPLPALKSPHKIIHSWAVMGDCDPNRLKSNTFSLEWPPRSGKLKEFPEADRAGWFGIEEAREKLAKNQRQLLEFLKTILA